MYWADMCQLLEKPAAFIFKVEEEGNSVSTVMRRNLKFLSLRLWAG
jgi:hypothetical protein